MCDSSGCPHQITSPPCGSNIRPYSPDADSDSDAGFSGCLSVDPLEFSRYELQEIRDKAQTLAEGLERGAERDALDALAKGADILDAIAARTDTEIVELTSPAMMAACGYAMYASGERTADFEDL